MLIFVVALGAALLAFVIALADISDPIYAVPRAMMEARRERALAPIRAEVVRPTAASSSEVTRSTVARRPL